MFKVGDKVKYSGNVLPELRGKVHTVQDIAAGLVAVNGLWYPERLFTLESSVEFKAGDRVRILGFVDPLNEGKERAIANELFLKGLTTGSERTIRAGKYEPSKLVIPYHDDPKANGGFIEYFKLELVGHFVQPTIKRDEAKQDEGDRMLAFFKASAHDPKASW
jgi:hypothetical protein